MISVAETLNDLAASWHRRLTDEEKAVCEDILDAAADLAAGTLPLIAFARLASGRQRFLALISTPTDDPRRVALLTAIDAVLGYQGVILWERGIYERDAA